MITCSDTSRNKAFPKPFCGMWRRKMPDGQENSSADDPREPAAPN